MLAPPQSLQVFLTRLCWQMLVPPQSLQVLLRRLCGQMLVPPQSLHLLLMQLCWQMPVPPQSLHLGGKIVYCERKGNIRVDVRARGRAKRSAPRKAAACAPGGTEGQ